MKKIFTSVVAIILFIALVGCTFSGTKTTVKIDFDTDGGSPVEAIIAKAGEEITMPANPTKEGFTFGGWYSDIDLTESFEFPEAMPEVGITLYAKWLVTLTFDANGGSSVAPIVGEPGGIFNLPANPTREGFVFVGWFYDAEYQNKLTYVLPKTNATVKARWQVYEEGSAINLPNNWLVNDEGSYNVSQVEGGVKIETTALKGEWSYVYNVIDGNAKGNTTVVAVVQGLEGTAAVLKLEGGNAEAPAEIRVEFTGEEQVVEWTVEDKNLTSVGGQKFLIFVNGGTVGCGETPEYIIVKSISLYHTIEADEPQRAVLSFMTNGGTEVESYYLAPGTAIQAPAAPEKENFIFTGWFADAALTQEYQFSVMPSVRTIVYAGWKPAALYLEDCDLMGGEFSELDPDAYEIHNNADSYVLKKLSEAEWTFMVLPMTGKSLAGYNLLRVEIQGTAGEKVLLKINDCNPGERWVTLTGEKQYFEFEFDFDLDPNKSLVVALEPGVAASSHDVTITKLAFGNYKRYINLLVEGWQALDDGVYNVALEDGVLTFDKYAAEGVEWSCIALDLEDENFINFDGVLIKVQGPAGEQLLVKANDTGGSGEHWITCDGTVQTVQYTFDFEINKNKHTMVLFANGGAAGTGHEFKVYELALIMTKEPVEPEPEPEEPRLVSLMGGEITALDDGHYIIQNNANSYVLQKTEAASEWTFAVLPMTGLDIAGLNVLRVELQGPAGQQILLKMNDENPGERWVTCTGAKQELEFVFDLNLDPSRPFVFCLTGGVAGASGEFTITKLAYSNYQTEANLLAEEFVPNGESKYQISQEGGKLVFSKDEEGGPWECIIAPALAAFDGRKLLSYDIEFKGPEGEAILLKLNDSVEEWITCTGAVQTLHKNVPISFSGAKSAFVLFANAGANGTGNDFEVTKLVLHFEELVKEAPVVTDRAVNLLGGTINELDNGHYVIQNNETSYVLQKTAAASEWTFATLSMAGKDLEGLNILRVELQGPEGEQILIKINDQLEKWITCTGAKQYLEFPFEIALDPSKALVFCLTGGVAGASGEFTITKLEYANYSLLLDVLSYDFELNGGSKMTFAQEAGKLTFSKALDGGEWDCLIVGPQAELDGKVVVAIEVEYKGPEGEHILIKPFNDGSLEANVECTGAIQTYSKTCNVTISGAANLFVLFANPGAAGTTNNFEVTKIVLRLAE